MCGVSSEEVEDIFIPVPGKRWSLVQTRPRNEKKALQGLKANGIISYLPLITKVEIHNRGRRERYLPMFPGYLFSCQSYEEDTLIRRDKCVWNLRTLEPAEEQSLLGDLKAVRRCELLSKDHKLVVNPDLQAGDIVRFRTGPFKNQDVIVVRRKNEVSVLVNLNFLGRNIEIECGADELIP